MRYILAVALLFALCAFDATAAGRIVVRRGGQVNIINNNGVGGGFYGGINRGGGFYGGVNRGVGFYGGINRGFGGINLGGAYYGGSYGSGYYAPVPAQLPPPTGPVTITERTILVQ